MNEFSYNGIFLTCSLKIEEDMKLIKEINQREEFRCPVVCIREIKVDLRVRRNGQRMKSRKSQLRKIVVISIK